MGSAVEVILLDTSVVIALRKKNDVHHQVAVESLGRYRGEVAISTITLTESLIQPMQQSGAIGRELALTIAGSLDHIFDFTAAMAIEAAEIRSRGKLTMADAMISATAGAHQAQLWTLDAKLAKAHKGSRLLA
jgi:predicted nucleic acid-binding protein